MRGVFRTYEKNDAGRDFVVGDIHGAFDSVLARMGQVSFDVSKDRLFSLGDLIDRGHQSVRVLKFLEQPFVHAIRGNHCDDFSNLTLDEIRVLSRLNWNGMGWANAESDEVIMAIQKALAALPIAIEVETARGTVGLVHADVPKGMSWKMFKRFLMDGDKDVIHTALYSRARIDNRDVSGVPGIDRLFVGHSIQWDGPTRLGNVYHIDCGAVFKELNGDAGFLAMANLTCHSQAIAPVFGTSTTGVYPESASGPFGAYGSEPIRRSSAA
jgi:serine/threonine protein phosphatase 1